MITPKTNRKPECVGRCDALCPNLECYNQKSWVTDPLTRDQQKALLDHYKQLPLRLVMPL